jgi:hypothetical protein
MFGYERECSIPVACGVKCKEHSAEQYFTGASL